VDPALASADQWATPRWQRYPKHLSPSQRKKPWAQVVQETRERSHPSYYHPDFLGRIEELETTTINDGKLLYEDYPVRYFWHEFGQIIGASCGEETKFVLVEWYVTGQFHGHPVTRKELDKKRRDHEDH
jgi:hypothetical protein